MKVYREIPQLKESILTIGSFDGLHLGHQFLIQETLKIAKEKNLPFYLVSFEPHPRLVLKHNNDFKLIQTWDEKIDKLNKMGVEHLIAIPFTENLAQQSAEYFVTECILKPLKPKVIVLGYDHKFGKDRQGSKETFMYIKDKLNLNFEVVQLHEYLNQRTKISSSIIRQYLLGGQMHEATNLLGEPYTLTGKVVEGKKFGRILGYPTANIQPESNHKLIPAYGVYHCDIELDGETFTAATNIGLNPTVETLHTPVIEAHILNFNRDIYGKTVKIHFIDYLRKEEKYDNIEQLKEAIEADVAKIKSLKATKF